MFTLPEAKRVRRKDLDDSASASSSSGEEEVGHDPEAELALRAKLNAQLSGLLDFNFKVEPKAQQQPKDKSEYQAPDPTSDAQQEDEKPEEEAFAFRLFRDEALTHTVVLTEDTAALGDGGFVVPSRPRSYYIASPPSPGKMSEYQSVAVSPEYILADAKRRRWGLEKPWRVIHITPDSKSASVKAIPGPAQEDGSAEKKKRTRPGKKHRIVLRVREKAARDREEAAKKMIIEKEEHLQEKKKRLNRERKLKRRQKEREKKAEAQAANLDGDKVDDGPKKDAESVPGDE